MARVQFQLPDHNPSVAHHIEHAGTWIIKWSERWAHEIVVHFREKFLGIERRWDEVRKINPEYRLTPDAQQAILGLAEILAQRWNRSYRLDPLTSACLNFVQGNKLSDPTAELIATILGDTAGTRFAQTCSGAGAKYIAASLEAALTQILESIGARKP